MYDLQKANMLKRIAAAVLDLILLSIVAVGVAFLLSVIFRYDSYDATFNEIRGQYEEQYGVDFNISAEEYEKLSKEEHDKYDMAFMEFSKNEEAVRAYNIMFQLILLITIFSILLGYLILEFAVPLIFKNGQTVGKKIFGIGVMREDGVRVTPILMLIRTALGKYTAETMLPVFIVISAVFGQIGLLGLVLIIALLVMQIVLLITSKTRTPIHDKLAHTVTVDLASQMIFKDEAALIKYKQDLAAERAANASYF